MNHQFTESLFHLRHSKLRPVISRTANKRFEMFKELTHDVVPAIRAAYEQYPAFGLGGEPMRPSVKDGSLFIR
jgi:hypothetical protein